MSQQLYTELLSEGIKAEDARYLLPMGTVSNMLVTMNARSLLNFFELRLCKKAQQEIRELAERMLSAVKQVAPVIFSSAGPPCIKGNCPEEDEECFLKMSREFRKKGEI